MSSLSRSVGWVCLALVALAVLGVEATGHLPLEATHTRAEKAWLANPHKTPEQKEGQTQQTQATQPAHALGFCCHCGGTFAARCCDLSWLLALSSLGATTSNRLTRVPLLSAVSSSLSPSCPLPQPS